jgi:hypothetical protein
MGLKDMLNKATNRATNAATQVATGAAAAAATTAVSGAIAGRQGSDATAAGGPPPDQVQPAQPAPILPQLQDAPVASATGALEPIAGITLERYAELAAKMADCDGDLEVCAQIAEQNGVDRPTWQAAMDGWNARMNDQATAAEVALAYMPLYQHALSLYGGERATATYDEYLEMIAMINTDLKEGDVRPVPFEPMYERFGINAPKWSQISTDWVEKLNADPGLYKRYGDECVARIKELDELWLATHTLPW